MSEMIERVARAICARAGDNPDAFISAEHGVDSNRQVWSDYIEHARAAIEAAPPVVEFHQHDWIPGFAAFHSGATTLSPDSRAFCVLNLGSILGTVAAGHVPASEVPYLIAESMMHEVMHVLEQWAGAEFSEERVEELLERYRASCVSDGSPQGSRPKGLIEDDSAAPERGDAIPPLSQ